MTAPRRVLPETPSQTAGPYVHIGCMPNFAQIAGVYPEDPGARMILGRPRGTPIELVGRILDGRGQPLRDAMVEIWQADGAGRFPGADDPDFTGWGRSPSDAVTGDFAFATVKPGRVAWPDGRMQAPHVSLWIFARGLNMGLHTRAYFDDEDAANAEDPLLNRLDFPDRRATLIARTEGPGRYRFDIRLQGEGETVFFDI